MSVSEKGQQQVLQPGGEAMTGRPKLTQQRRLQTLEAAVEVIGERGLCETRIADIARRAGLSPALLLYYFGSKDNLLTEALTFSEDRFYLSTFHELADTTDSRVRLVKLIDMAIPPDKANGRITGDWTLWVELWARALRDQEAARKRLALDRRWRTTIAEIVRTGQRNGEFATRVDPDEFALGLGALMDGLLIQLLLDDPDISANKMRRLCLEAATGRLGFEIPDEVSEFRSVSRRRAARHAG
jgi:AcrR family transcriptional regulator